MAFQDIIKKINNNASEKAEEILREARVEEEKLLKKAKNRGHKQVSTIREKGRVQAEQRLKRMKQAADIHIMKLQLTVKQEIMEEVFAKAESELNSLSDNEYREFIKKMVKGAAVSGDEEILTGNKDKNRLGKSWLKEVNKELAEIGTKGRVKFSKKTMDQDGGFILIRANIHTNCTFESLIKSCKDKLEPKIAEVLFQ